jgi:hypothetical protein
MQKVFSVKDNTIQITPIGSLVLYDSDTCGLVIPPQSLIKKPPSDEELAERWVFERYGMGKIYNRGEIVKAFEAGRKSYGDKKFHLSESDLLEIIDKALDYKGYDATDLLPSITPQPTYPTTITVDYDGENYDWETIKVEY